MTGADRIRLGARALEIVRGSPLGGTTIDCLVHMHGIPREIVLEIAERADIITTVERLHAPPIAITKLFART